jgi:hypothetical protein
MNEAQSGGSINGKPTSNSGVSSPSTTDNSTKPESALAGAATRPQSSQGQMPPTRTPNSYLSPLERQRRKNRARDGTLPPSPLPSDSQIVPAAVLNETKISPREHVPENLNSSVPVGTVFSSWKAFDKQRRVVDSTVNAAASTVASEATTAPPTPSNLQSSSTELTFVTIDASTAQEEIKSLRLPVLDAASAVTNMPEGDDHGA